MSIAQLQQLLTDRGIVITKLSGKKDQMKWWLQRYDGENAEEEGLDTSGSAEAAAADPLVQAAIHAANEREAAAAEREAAAAEREAEGEIIDVSFSFPSWFVVGEVRSEAGSPGVWNEIAIGKVRSSTFPLRRNVNTILPACREYIST